MNLNCMQQFPCAAMYLEEILQLRVCPLPYHSGSNGNDIFSHLIADGERDWSEISLESGKGSFLG